MVAHNSSYRLTIKKETHKKESLANKKDSLANNKDSLANKKDSLLTN